MLCVSFHIDRIKAALPATPDKDVTILPDHAALVAALHRGDPASLPLEERLIVFSYLRDAVSAQARSNDHFLDQMYYHPYEGIVSTNGVSEMLYYREIAILQKISDSLDYSDHLKSKIAQLTENVCDDLIQIKDVRQAFLHWEYYDLNQKWLEAYGFLGVFTNQAQEIFNFPVTQTKFFWGNSDAMKTVTMLSLNPPSYEPHEWDYHEIHANPDTAPLLSPVYFFSVLHHESIHNLLLQMAIAHVRDECGTEFRTDACQQWLRKKYSVNASGEIQSLYFSNAEERICFANDLRAAEKLSQLSPSRQLSYAPLRRDGPV